MSKSVRALMARTPDAPAALGQAWAEHRVPLMAALTAKLGDLDRAEDALSEAALRAQRSWSAAIPDNPSGWLYRVALNVGLDDLRRKARHADAQPTLISQLTMIEDDQLCVSPEARLHLFGLCSDPHLSQDQQIALILFHLAGLDCTTIARAFLVKETTIYQRLSRARAILRQDRTSPTEQLSLTPSRSALELIYLQSYRDAAGGTESNALGRDALQLVQVLCDAAPDEAENWALKCLLHLLEARRPARLSEAGLFIPLDRQAVSDWSSAHQRMGAAAMQKVAEIASQPEPYALRAQIELTRMRARRENGACDEELLELYDLLLRLTGSPFAMIERALVLARINGPAAGLAALEAKTGQTDLSGHAGWHLARADLHEKLGDRARTRLHLTSALTLIEGRAEKAFVEAKLHRLPA